MSRRSSAGPSASTCGPADQVCRDFPACAPEEISAATIPGLLVRHQEDKSFRTSMRWLFESGAGATRQLVTYREIRQPDLAAGAYVAATALGVLAAARGHRLTGAALPAGFVLAASVQHVRSRFETPRADWPRLAPAVAADSALLAAYFLGRLAGLAGWRRRLPSPRAKIYPMTPNEHQVRVEVLTRACAASFPRRIRSPARA